MSDILVTSPYRPFTLPNQFKAVFNGYIYCGTVDAVDPSVSQVQVYLVNESGDKVPVSQPLRTNAGGFLVYNGQPAKFVTDSNHSLLVRDYIGNQIWYAKNVANIDPQSMYEFINSGAGTERNGKWSLRDKISIKDYFFAGEADYTNAMARARADAISSSSGFDTICLEFPSGVYPYTASPNWAIPRLEIRCNPGVVFKHTGSGKALVFDGGETGGGVFCVRLTGDPLIQGNASTTIGVYTRAVHHSKFEARVRDVSTAILETAWAVCNEYHVRSSPLGEPAFAVTPTLGMLLGERAPLESTSACTFYNPVISAVTAYGLNLQSAVMNTFIGGTVEGCGSGVFISDKCFGNTFNNTDFEFNTSADIFCQGVENTFIGVLSDKEIEFSAASARNKLIGGRTNNIKIAGDRNEFHGTLYGIAGGDFNDSGTGTVTRNLATAIGITPLPDRGGNVAQSGSMGLSDADALVYGAANLISGGPASDVDFFKRGAGSAHLRATGGVNALSWGYGGLGFYGATPIGKPFVSGSTGGNAALTSLITALASLGLINNSGVTP